MAERKNRTKFKAWITKYALTKGIYETEVEDCFDTSQNMVKAAEHQYFHAPDWHRHPESAQQWAEKMRTKRIASLKKQIEKLEALKF